MSEYDPFARGPFPAGVRTHEITDPARERRLPMEHWYPAVESNKGRDLDKETQDRFRFMPGFQEIRQAAVRDAEPAEGRFPLVVFSHGFAGHRRQTTHFCTHLASHGYVVASPDHMGNTMPEILQMAAQIKKEKALPDASKYLAGMTRDRLLDMIFTVDSILAMGGEADPERIGVTGHSYGGLTTLLTAGSDKRIRAALPLAPGGGKSRINQGANLLGVGLDMDWDREVPVLYLVAELDSLLPIDGMRELFGRTHPPKDMVVLKNADHFHFCDGVEKTHDLFRKMGGMAFGIGAGDRVDPMTRSKPSSELCPGDKAYAFLQGLGLSHMDAHLKHDPKAIEFLQGDLSAVLADRGIEAEVVRG